MYIVIHYGNGQRREERDVAEAAVDARVAQILKDGVVWADDGTRVIVPASGIDYLEVSEATGPVGPGAH